MSTEGWVLGLAASVAEPGGSPAPSVRAHLDALTKPPGSLGRLEDLAVRLAAIYGDPPPPLRDRVVIVLAGDHGVASRGVSAYPQDVTQQMCLNIGSGGAAINALAGAVGARVVVADLGVLRPCAGAGVLQLNVRRGSRDLAQGPALTREEVCRAIRVGAERVMGEEATLVGLGEMGIGNSTSAAALTAALTGMPVDAVVGPGTGVHGVALARKRDAVVRGVARLSGDEDGVELLAQLGGLEIAGLVGVTLAAAGRGRAVVLDGFISTAAAAVAVRMAPRAARYLVASHRSVEPGHALLLDLLGLVPVLDLSLRLGEGTGAALAFPIVDAAGSILREMATFSVAGVAGPIAGEADSATRPPTPDASAPGRAS